MKPVHNGGWAPSGLGLGAMLLFLGGAGLLGGGPITASNRSAQASAPDRLERLSAADAFRYALGALKGNVDFLSRTGVASVSRQTNHWEIQLKKYPDIPPEGLTIAVRDDTSIKVALTENGRPAADWLAKERGAKDNTRNRMRPEVAFRKGMAALSRVRVSPEDFFAPGGRIQFYRGRAEESWRMEVSGYPAMPLEGYWVSILDDGTTKIMSAL